MSKRASSSGSSSSNRSRSSGGHKEGWDPLFAVSYPWALPVEDRDEPSKIIGVLCKLCRKHQHNHAGTWTDKPLIGCISNPTNPSPLRTALQNSPGDITACTSHCSQVSVYTRIHCTMKVQYSTTPHTSQLGGDTN